MSTQFPHNTSALLSLIDDEWMALMRAVNKLTPEQMSKPDSGGWSPKDNLAHLETWMRYMKDAYLHKMPRPQAMGIPAAEYQKLDEDGMNAIIFERNRNRSASDVLDGLKSTYADITRTLAAFPYDQLLKPVQEGGPDKRIVMETVLGNTSSHFREHRLNIEKGL